MHNYESIDNIGTLVADLVVEKV